MINPILADAQSSYRLLTSLNLILLIGAGVIALAIGVVSFLSNKASAALVQAKDDQTTRDIAKVRADAETKLGIETERVRIEAANDLKIKTEEVRQEAKTEQKRIETEANKKIEANRAQADVQIAEARRETENVRQQNLATESRLEAERLTRLEMEKSFTPRAIPLIIKDGVGNFDPLRLFAGVNVIIECLPDAEPRRLASDLAMILNAAGWHLVGHIVVRGEIFQDGVMVDGASRWNPDLSTGATEAVVTFLVVNNIHASDFPGRSPRATNVQPNTVRIRVGLLPDPYFRQKAMDNSLDENSQREARQKRKLSEQTARARREQQWAELWQEWHKQRGQLPK